MKQFKKILAVLMCAGVVLGVTACGDSNKADDQSKKDETTESTDQDKGKNNNDVTEGTEEKDKTDTTDDTAGDAGDSAGEGMIDKAGDDLKDGAEEIGDAVTGDDDRADKEEKDTNN